MRRNSLLISGLIGLTGALLLTATAVIAMLQGWIPVLLTRPPFVWGLFLFLLVFAVLEIPLMIFGMQKMADSPNAKYLVLLTNTAFTFFAAVYALPFILLTGGSWLTLGAGIAMAALTIIRFISAMVYLPHDQQL
jgi:hypothetical protein